MALEVYSREAASILSQHSCSDKISQKRLRAKVCECIKHEIANWGHYFYVSDSDSFPVAPEAVLTRTHCIKGRPHENRGALPSLPRDLDIISPRSFIAFEEQISRDWERVCFRPEMRLSFYVLSVHFSVILRPWVIGSLGRLYTG